MSEIITQNRIVQDSTVNASFAEQFIEHVTEPGETQPGHVERRRAGRNNDVSPGLIALMRKPTTEARIRVLLYDAPNFVLATAPTHRRSPYHTVRMVIAVAASSLAWAAAFKGMMILWG